MGTAILGSNVHIPGHASEICTKNVKSTAASGSRLLCGPRTVAVLVRAASSRAKQALIIPDM